MGRFRGIFHKIIISLIDGKGRRYSKVLLSLSIAVVFVTTYLLIMPAFTLDRAKAARQGGIDVPAAVSAESYGANYMDSNTEAADAVVESGNAEGGNVKGSNAETAGVGAGTGNADDADAGAGPGNKEDGNAKDGNADDSTADAGTDNDDSEVADAGADNNDAGAAEAGADPAKAEDGKVGTADAGADNNDAGTDDADDGADPANEADGNVKDGNADAGEAAEGGRRVLIFEGWTLKSMGPAGNADPDAEEGGNSASGSGGRGARFRVTVIYGPDAGVPEGAGLSVRELSGNDYREYVDKAAGAMEAAGFSYARIFDISIIDEEGIEVQPQAEVDVSIQLLDGDDAEDFSVVHFAGEDEEPEIEDTITEGDTVSFSTGSFSAYAIVQGPEELPEGMARLRTLDELMQYAADGVFITTQNGGFSLGNEIVLSASNPKTSGIFKNKPGASYPSPDTASRYYFEAVPGTDDQFYVYCLSGTGSRQYVQNQGQADLYYTDAAGATAFTIDVNNNGAFRLYSGNRYWNMWNDTNGTNIAAYTSPTDKNNYFHFWKYDEEPGDPFGMDGYTYGLMSWSEGVTGKAMMAESSNANSLDALSLTVMARTGSNSDKLFVPDESDITEWTFEWLEGDKYHLTTEVDGETRYLRIHPSGLSLVSTPDDNCRIQLVSGSGAHAGEISLKNGSTTLTFTGSTATGFKTGGSAGTEWLRLVEKSELTADYFLTYSASKISVSDPSVTNESRIIIYTRVWNEETKRYEMYAVDHDGSLIHCYESGDSIQWTGTRLNSMLWNFTEYYWEGTEDPNYYYDLYNQYSGKYLSVIQDEGGSVLTDEAVGINLTGRKAGRYYTPILQWDDDKYTYMGLKADLTAGKVVPVTGGSANDFYFAIMQDLPEDDHLTTVPTVDHVAHGITMRLADFPDRNTMSNFLGSNAGGATNNTVPALLASNLENGYPKTKAGNDLADWFSDAQEVNHLFVQSTYSATGYYEYDSAQNFASLHGDDFVVYKEIATVDGGTSEHYKHGQFFPYNDITAGSFSEKNPQNLTTSGGQNLPESDPRKYESLYLVRNPNYYMGMELEASFVQTPNGCDAWGHDIIYEFTGDDDFWLYVDGELVIDLGGIHNALSGSVNFRTGQVVVNGDQTTLRELFESNYRGRNPQATQDEVDAFLADYFEEGETIFRDYTTHTMKIFYLERGAGASNLHMRFNLSSVRPGTVQLSKELSGVDESESALAVFPYHIEYKTKAGEDAAEVSHVMVPGVDGAGVVYKDTVTPVEFRRHYTVGGITYDDVYLLRPGEIAEIEFPADTTTYRITECGVDTSVYDKVSVNGEEIEGVEGGSMYGAGGDGTSGREDYPIPYETTQDRAHVNYDNEVNPDALRTLTIDKKLFREDGITPISAAEDDTTFSFRLYFGTETEETLGAADMYTYHVRDPEGYYCRWDAENRRFEPTEWDDYPSLNDEQKDTVSFMTSMNGSISRIPSGYRVEIREVLAGTKFRLEERDYEIPDGYSRQKYDLYNDIEDMESGGQPDWSHQTDPPQSTVVAGEDPHVDVCNLKGWGLRVNKTWADEDYMEERDPVYFAVFYSPDAGSAPAGGSQTEDEDLVMIGGTLREMPQSEHTLYWYFPHLSGLDGVPAGATFSNFVIREVEVAGAVVDDNGYVTSYTSADPVADEGTTLIHGTQKGESSGSDIEYTVLYDPGDIEQDSNVRIDSVTNDRPGIEIRKTDWEGNPLAGAMFTLKDSNGLIGTFTADSDGLITEAFLSDDKDYTLTEVVSPDGYRGLDSEMTIRLTDGVAAVSLDGSAGSGAEYYSVAPAEGKTETITIRNRTLDLQILKKGRKSNGDVVDALSGVHFAIHREITVDHVTSMELDPIPGYDDIVSGDDGMLVLPEEAIHDLHDTHQDRSYYLIEKDAPPGYQKLTSGIRFTISKTGEITLRQHSNAGLTSEYDPDQGTLTYTLTVIDDESAAKLRIIKTDQEGNALEGAGFSISGDGIDDRDDLVSAIAPGDESQEAVIYINDEVPVGTYTLTETAVPAGYYSLEDPVIISVTSDNRGMHVTASMGGKQFDVTQVVLDRTNNVWTVKVRNSAGVELPHTGGAGTAQFYILGSILAIGCGVLLAVRRRMTL